MTEFSSTGLARLKLSLDGRQSLHSPVTSLSLSGPILQIKFMHSSIQPLSVGFIFVIHWLPEVGSVDIHGTSTHIPFHTRKLWVG